jgi:hypothetical protein
MRRVLAALVAVFIVANALTAVAACAGWEFSAAARMACCMRAHDGCPDQMSADACCARSEQAHQPTVAGDAAKSAASSGAVAAIAAPHPADSVTFVVGSEPFVRSRHFRPPRSPATRSPILRI